MITNILVLSFSLWALEVEQELLSAKTVGQIQKIEDQYRNERVLRKICESSTEESKNAWACVLLTKDIRLKTEKCFSWVKSTEVFPDKIMSQINSNLPEKCRVVLAKKRDLLIYKRKSQF